MLSMKDYIPLNCTQIWTLLSLGSFLLGAWSQHREKEQKQQLWQAWLDSTIGIVCPTDWSEFWIHNKTDKNKSVSFFYYHHMPPTINNISPRVWGPRIWPAAWGVTLCFHTRELTWFLQWRIGAAQKEKFQWCPLSQQRVLLVKPGSQVRVWYRIFSSKQPFDLSRCGYRIRHSLKRTSFSLWGSVIVAQG